MINEPEDVTVVAELDLALLRVNIYVNGSRFTVDHEEAYRELILHDGILISFVNCGGNRLAVYQSSVYEYDLKAPEVRPVKPSILPPSYLKLTGTSAFAVSLPYTA